MDAHSESLLAHVHPDLAKVIRATAQTPQPFIVVYGIRSIAAEQQAVATGHSQTMHSRHLPNKDGVSCAVDLAALTDGHIDWAGGREQQVYGAIVEQVRAAALADNIPVEFGAEWHTFKDWGHVQLPWAQYP